MALTDYIRFFRFRYHITFISVVLGAFIFANEVTASLINSLFLLYLSFNLLLYGGIYTMNDIADAKSDAMHPMKRKRPLPSKRISIKSAMVFASVLIVAGLLGAFVMFNRQIFYICVATLALNIFYTFIAKKIPYLELLVNSSTHPLRFLMGTLLVTAKLPYIPIVAIFFLTLGLSCIRRIVEKDVEGWQARNTLKYYTKNSLLIIQLLAFLAIAFISIVDVSTTKAFYLALFITYFTLVFGTYFSGRIRKLFRVVWTN